jgi:hypothetical protein
LRLWPEDKLHQPLPLKRAARTCSHGILLDGSA